jgi:hypothetical protein
VGRLINSNKVDGKKWLTLRNAISENQKMVNARIFQLKKSNEPISVIFVFGEKKDFDFVKLEENWKKSMVEKFPGFSSLGLSDAVDQFSNFILSQTDLRTEGANIKKFRANFENNENINFPEIYEKYLKKGSSSEQIIK